MYWSHLQSNNEALVTCKVDLKLQGNNQPQHALSMNANAMNVLSHNRNQSSPVYMMMNWLIPHMIVNDSDENCVHIDELQISSWYDVLWLESNPGSNEWSCLWPVNYRAVILSMVEPHKSRLLVRVCVWGMHWSPQLSAFINLSQERGTPSRLDDLRQHHIQVHPNTRNKQKHKHIL